MSEKDCADLAFALGLRVDIIALSFVRSPADIDLVHKIMDENGRAAARDREAGEARGRRQPRGDRPGLRRDHGRPRRPRRGAAARARAARAEAGDPDRPRERQAGDRRHPDARLDDHQLAPDPRRGQRRRERRARRRRRRDAVRRDQRRPLPDQSVRDDGRRSSRPSRRARRRCRRCNHVPRTQRGVLSFAARDIGERLSARALVAFSVSGDTVRRLARLHTRLPLLAFTPEPEVRSQLAMSWGVETFLVDYVTSTDAMVRQVDNAILSIGRFKAGDLVVIVAGSPPGDVGLDEPDPRAPPGRGGSRLRAAWPRGWRVTRPRPHRSTRRSGRRGQAALDELVAAARPRAARAEPVPRHQPADGPTGCSAARSPGRRWWRPGAPWSRSGPCTRCTRTSCGPAIRAVPIVFEVERVRDGRSFTTRRVRAVQHGEVIFALWASFQLPAARASSTPSPAPAVPDPEDAARPGRVAARRRGFLAGVPRPLDLRFVDEPPCGTSRPRAGERPPAAGVDAGGRHAAGRPDAARLPAHLRQRPHPARSVLARARRCP